MAQVKYTNNDETVQVEEGAAMKDVTQENAWNIPYGCEDGLCGTCLVRVAKGKENLSPVEEKEEITLSAMGVELGEFRLCCQTKVQGDVEIETM